MNAVDGVTIERRIRISRPDGMIEASTENIAIGTPVLGFAA